MTALDESGTGLPANDCTVCTHAQAAEIDAGLLGGTSVRATAETFGLSRSSVGRHRLNHLSAEAAIGSDEYASRGPLQIVDVHGSLAALADRLEKVVELAAKTRKATAAIGAIRELRQTLVAIAELQANPDLQRAASAERLIEKLDEKMADALVRMIDAVLSAFDRSPKRSQVGGAAPSHLAVSSLIAQCLRKISEHGVDANFDDIDVSEARAWVEGDALDRARRLEEEVQHRVEQELRRREAQQRPALEAKPQLAIDGGVEWTV